MDYIVIIRFVRNSYIDIKFKLKPSNKIKDRKILKPQATLLTIFSIKALWSGTSSKS